MRRLLLLVLMATLLLGGSLAVGQEVTPEASGSLQVTDVLPTPDSGDIATDAVITVIFNRPVVPLTTIEESRQLPSPISITPAIQGQGEWLNTSIYTFRPDPAFMGGTKYSIVVNPDLVAIDGSTLAEPFIWSFTTSSPMVTAVLPEALSLDVALREPVQITFNMPVDRESVEAAFVLRPLVPDSVNVSGEFEWSDDSTGFSFTPDERLELFTAYSIEIEGGQVVSAGGGQPMAEPFLSSFTTVPLPALSAPARIQGTARRAALRRHHDLFRFADGHRHAGRQNHHRAGTLARI